jgi:prepilin-type N-terminal cleavage/methylation domain-containing protein
MRSEGFTFVELIVVLAILAGLAALVAPSFSRTVASARLRTAASDVRSTFARARALAVASARERSAVFDLSKGEFGIDNVDLTLYRDDGKSVQLTASELALFIEGCELVGRRTLSPVSVKPKVLALDRAV